VSAAKQKGTAWETRIVTFLRDHGFTYADRVPLSGHKDRGDVTTGPGSPVIEAKNQARHSLAEWLTEAEQERDNAKADTAVVWIKRRGFTSPGRGYVVMSGDDYVWLLKSAGYGGTP
jgi:hypothetical protein